MTDSPAAAGAKRGRSICSCTHHDETAGSTDRDGVRFDIYTIGVDGKDLRRPIRSQEDAFEPAWSPDGREIAFSRGGAIVVVTLSGVERQLTDPEDNDSSPAWSPASETDKEGS